MLFLRIYSLLTAGRVNLPRTIDGQIIRNDLATLTAPSYIRRSIAPNSRDAMAPFLDFLLTFIHRIYRIIASTLFHRVSYA